MPTIKRKMSQKGGVWLRDSNGIYRKIFKKQSTNLSKDQPKYLKVPEAAKADKYWNEVLAGEHRSQLARELNIKRKQQKDILKSTHYKELEKMEREGLFGEYNNNTNTRKSMMYPLSPFGKIGNTHNNRKKSYKPLNKYELLMLRKRGAINSFPSYSKGMKLPHINPFLDTHRRRISALHKFRPLTQEEEDNADAYEKELKQQIPSKRQSFRTRKSRPSSNYI